MRFTHCSRCSEPSFGRRVLTATERSRAIVRTGRSFHLGNLWRRGGDCAFHAFLTLFGTVLRTSCPDGHRTPAGYRPYRSFFSSWEIYGGEGEIRTPGTDKRYNRFRVCRIRPLCHLSINIFRQVKGLTPSEICCSGYAVQQVRTSR